MFIGTSLDGRIARPDGDLGWLTDPPSGRQHAQITTDRRAQEWDTFFPGVDAMIMGRHTYETVLGFGEWPYTGKHVLVISSGLQTDDERVRVVRDLDEAASVLAELDARDVYVDGGITIQSALRRGWIDEITVGVAPVLIGAGALLFGDLDDNVLLELVGVHATDSGMVNTTYRVAR